MKRKLALGAGLMAFGGIATVGGIAIAGTESDRELERTVVAEPITATEPGPITRGKNTPVIQTFYAQDLVTPPEGGGVVLGLQCPKNAGGAIGGGAATQEGIVVSYLSQLNPDDLTSSKRVYYIGVDHNSGPQGAGAILEVHCAKKVKVKK